MAFSEAIDGTLEITIPVEEIRYRSDGELKKGLTFKSFLQVHLADGTDLVIQNPLMNLEFHDPAAGHGLIVFKLEQSARDQGDGNVINSDDANP